MAQEFDAQGKVHITRDSQGTVRDLLHVEETYESTASTALLAAREYLDKFGDRLGIIAAELTNFSLSPEPSPIDAGVEYRFEQEKTQFDSTTVVLSQTVFGLPIWEAGVAVHMRQRPFVVSSAQSTRHPSVDAAKPSERALARVRDIDPRTLAGILGLTEKTPPDTKAQRARKEPGAQPSTTPSIKRQRLIVYQYDESKRTKPDERPGGEPGAEVKPITHPSLPLPPVAPDISHGRHYVAAEIIFSLTWRDIEDLPWVALVEVETLSVLYLRAFVDEVTGLVFEEDPITLNNGPAPSAPVAALNPLRTSVLLPDLAPPVGGIYSLIGDRVQLVDAELPAIAAPTSPAGTNFDFAARTNNFAAVNAYYHNDRFFRLVEELGFDLHTYCTGTVFPSVVDHRGRIGSATGQEINAHCVGNGTFGIARTTYMLADLTDVVNPMGLACDWRVVLHELGGHGILYGHVNSPNFGFSHSAGDSFGAILNDPESRAADRFQTFPWVFGVIARRHDRSVTAGWAWGGAFDTGGYNSEQILCTTHFRLYRSIGGDSLEVAMRIFASRYVAYLMLRTIGSLTQPTNPGTPTLYASALIAAELGNWTSEGHVGAVYWKVIRWAFEKQGLYQPPGAPTPVVSEGAPPAVDVYIDDGRHGEYAFQPRFWETTDIWNRVEPDGQPGHQTPIVCKTNHAYVRVKNRGTQPAVGVRVYGYHCRPSAGLVWPDDFEPMTTASLAVPGAIAPGATALVGPFVWTPVHAGHECMFMSVSAPADRANTDRATNLPSALGPTPAWRLVPSDNNVKMRALIPVPGGGGRCALEDAFCNRSFWAHNPFARTARMEVRAILPPFLAGAGWTMRFENPGQGSFSLGPRESRQIRPRLLSGRDFSAGDVIDSGAAAIVVLVLADGMVVGGLTFVLDPSLTEPARETRTPEERKAQHEHDKERCCKPCIDDRCKDDCLCCEKHRHGCAPAPCEPPKPPDRKSHDECCDERPGDECRDSVRGRPRRIWVEIEVDQDRDCTDEVPRQNR
jgi:hypothetical protein